MKVWVVYKCKRYERTNTPYPCVLAVLSDMEKAKSFARTNGAWVTEVEIDKIGTNECNQ
ncbi:MAG TPA: hypothetical protein VK487_12125 [Candidatus Bathyarchaeia archaeon]|nr:hypothetical protein [Candidatus Bathyarchaeia archaeon]